MDFDMTYFILRRKIFESAIWSDDPHILKLFIYLIGNARYDKKPKKYPGFEIKRCELVTSLNQIAENNEYLKNGTLKKWSRQKVSRMLKILSEQGYIKILSDTYGTHISIVNYATYQLNENDRTDTSVTVPDTSVTGVDITKKDKEGIERKEVIKKRFDIFWDKYGKVGNKKTALSKWLKLKEQDHIDIMDNLERYLTDSELKQNGGFKVQAHASTYLNQERWKDEISNNGKPEQQAPQETEETRLIKEQLRKKQLEKQTG